MGGSAAGREARRSPPIPRRSAHRLVHRVPWGQMRWLTELTERLWEEAHTGGGGAVERAEGEEGATHAAHAMRAHGTTIGTTSLRVRASCDEHGPPCPTATCAHAHGQRVCSLQVELPVGRASRSMGCDKCACWAAKGADGVVVRSGGVCNFTRASRPRLPEQCWQPVR